MRLLRFATTTLALLALLVVSDAAAQQLLQTPRPSPAAEVSQTVGISTITVNYSRPSVNDRTVWGGLVPYGQVWRTGANENTTVTLSHPVRVSGKMLPAGTYGLHAIPNEDQWTLVFSKRNNLWGSFGYDEAEDALRVTVTPRSAPHLETLAYSFPDVTDTAATMRLHWGEVAVDVPMEFDVTRIVFEQIDHDLRSVLQFNPAAWAQAAAFTAQHGIELDKGLTWIDRALGQNPSFANQAVKAQVLEKMGRRQDAEALIAASMPKATENEVNAYGYQLLFSGQTDRAIAVFEHNTKTHPDSWNVWDSLAEGYMTKGVHAEATRYYKKALAMAPDDQKDRITQTLARLEAN